MLVYMERADEFYALEWVDRDAHTLRGRVGRAGRLRQCGRDCDRDRALQLIARRREEGFREVPPPPGLSPRRAAQRRARLRGVAGAAVAGVLAPAFGPDGYVARVLPGGRLVELGVPLRGPQAAYFRVSVASLPRRIGDVQRAVSALGELEVPYQPWYLGWAHQQRDLLSRPERFTERMMSELKDSLYSLRKPELPWWGQHPPDDMRQLAGAVHRHGMRVDEASPSMLRCRLGEGDCAVRLVFQQDSDSVEVLVGEGDVEPGIIYYTLVGHVLREVDGQAQLDEAEELVGVVARFAADLQSRYVAFHEETGAYVAGLERDMRRRFGPRFGFIDGGRSWMLYVETARGRLVILPVRMGLDARLLQQQAEAIERLVEGCGLDLTVHRLPPDSAARVMRGVIT